MKKIAVITGASSGMGKRFVETINEYGKKLDEVWVIARREDRLKELKCAYPIRPVALDLTDRKSFDEYRALLEEEKPEIALLVNASGFGKFNATLDSSVEENLNMVDLNCQALMAMSQISITYMTKGSSIINIASVAAYQPIPYINVYAATKAFVLYFSRALNQELKKQGIAVMALCPFWTKTEFFNRAIEEDKDKVVKKFVAMYYPDQLVKRAWRDLKRGKEVSQYGFIARGQTLLTKIMPHSFVMWYWMNQQKLK